MANVYFVHLYGLGLGGLSTLGPCKEDLWIETLYTPGPALNALFAGGKSQ